MRRSAPGQGHDGADTLHRKRPIEMRKQVATPRFFPAQIRSERLALDRDEHEIKTMGEMAAGRLAQLPGGREMDKAILPVDCRTGEQALCQSTFPILPVADLIDRRHDLILYGNSHKPWIC